MKDLCVNFFNRISSSPPGFLSQPQQNLYIFISCRYLIGLFNSQWLEMNVCIWMRLLQNFLITNNAWVYFWAGSLIRMGLSLAKQLISPQKMLSILIFGSPVCTPLIPCHHYWNGWRPWLQQHTETWRADSPSELHTWWG